MGKGHNAAFAGGDGRSRIGLGAVGDGVGLRLLGQVQIDAARIIRHNALQTVGLVRGQGQGCDGGVCHRLVILIRQLDDCLVQGLLSVGDGGANGGCSVRSGAAAIVRSRLAPSELQAAAGNRNFIGSHGIAAAAACRLFCTGGTVAADDGYRAAGNRQSVCPNAVGLGAALKRQAASTGQNDTLMTVDGRLVHCCQRIAAHQGQLQAAVRLQGILALRGCNGHVHQRHLGLALGAQGIGRRLHVLRHGNGDRLGSGDNQLPGVRIIIVVLTVFQVFAADAQRSAVQPDGLADLGIVQIFGDRPQGGVLGRCLQLLLGRLGQGIKALLPQPIDVGIERLLLRSRQGLDGFQLWQAVDLLYKIPISFRTCRKHQAQRQRRPKQHAESSQTFHRSSLLLGNSPHTVYHIPGKATIDKL